jgi:transaldolase/glucose-6-phosphate isomerase
MTNSLVELQKLGQSPWHDNIRRGQLTSGALRKMVRAGDITGLTSNPTIFEQAIANSDDYDEAIETLARKGKSASEIFDALSIEDIREAADVFAPVFRRTEGGDGYVSIEVAPKYAHDTAATIREAHRLWRAVARPNLMVKIPATPAGIPAIEQCIADGLNINVTLIFSLQRYAEVMNAYLAGLERRRLAKKEVSRIASVASFFVSRVDTLVDRLLDEKLQALGGGETGPLQALKGLAAIANARLAYVEFRRKFTTERFATLAQHGARVQRPLWASTSTKNPAYPDVYYVEALIGPDTVDTMPPATLVAYKDHGRPDVRLDKDLDEATRALEQLEEFGIQMSWVTQKLEEDGVAAFAKSFDSLIAVVEARRQAVLFGDRQTAHLGGSRKAVDAALHQLASVKFGERLWKKDATLWKPDDPAHQAEIQIRLGWLDVVDVMQSKVAEMTTFAGEARRAGFTHALLCGMGGSSLAPEVLRATFGVAKGYLDLAVLDSTDPAAVIEAEVRSDPARTLYIIASKSGSTTEPNAMFRFFWHHLKALKGDRAGENFITITDPGSGMERTAREHGFRRIFLNPPEIGGRYSALSYFGLVPAALMGIDVAQLLDRARSMLRACAAIVSPERNPGLYLGAVMGALARSGRQASRRDKLTFVVDKRISTFGYWTEQLIAESTGKEGKGIVPIEGEPVGAPSVYGPDRVFVHLRFGKKTDRAVAALIAAGHPVIEIQLRDAYDLGAEFVRWEIATSAAGWVLDIDPFDQPNVQESKDNTVRLLNAFRAEGHLHDPGGAVAVDADDFAPRLRAHLKSIAPGDYVALTAYCARTPDREKVLRELRRLIRDAYRVATTVGYGPRFLHSTGQLHKGGAGNGVFLQFVSEDPIDAPIHGEQYTFSTLKLAQALGDYESLVRRGRRALRISLTDKVKRGLLQTLSVVKDAAHVRPVQKKSKKRVGTKKKRVGTTRKAVAKKPGRKKRA